MNDVVSIGLFKLTDAYLAYVGPGSGITMLWALLAVLGGILFMIVGLLFWPLRVLLRAIKKNKSKNGIATSPDPGADDSKVITYDKQSIPSSKRD